MSRSSTGPGSARGLLRLMAVLLLTAAALVATAGASRAQPVLGVYDPADRFASRPGVGLEHVFLYWHTYRTGEVQGHFARTSLRGRRLLVSLEPYTRAPDWRSGAETHLQAIAAGAFDPEIARFCRDVGETRAPIIVRWGGEMEDPTDGRYPWATNDPRAYIAAYRHFVTLCRTYAPLALYSWSPRGEPRLVGYYPGDDVVDYVGLTVWSLPSWDLAHFGRMRTLQEALADRYRHVARFGRPVMVTEFGVAGGPAHQRQWLEAGCRSLGGFPLLAFVVYFNDAEPWRWPHPYGSPDWRVDPSFLAGCSA